MNYLFAFVGALLLSFVLSKVLINVGLKFNLVSRPRKRDIHRKPVPRIGGIAIFSSFLVVALIIFLTDKNLSFGNETFLNVDRRFLGIFVGGLFVGLTMLYDDIRGLGAWQKFIIQVVAAVIVIASGVGINHLANPFGDPINLNTIYLPIFKYHGVFYHFSLLSDLLTLLWIVGIMNTINFVDGVDGLAGGLSEIACFTIFLLSISVAVAQPSTAIISIALAGSIAGFLFWNFPPAKIFMGDSGSMFLGFMLGLLPLISGGKLATVFLVLGFPILDGVIVVLSRIIKGKNPATTPDKTHLHHRFLDAGFSARQSILIMYLVSISFSWVALRSTTLDKVIAALVLVVAILALLFLLPLVKKIRHAKGEL